MNNVTDFSEVSLLAGKHSGETAFLFGKGPGLEAIDTADCGPLRICINESLLRVERPTYFFAHDEEPIKRVTPFWPDGCKAILEPRRAHLANCLGIPNDEIYSYQKRMVGELPVGWNARDLGTKTAWLEILGPFTPPCTFVD